MKRILVLLAAALLCCGAANAQQTATQVLTLTVNASPVIITTTHLPNAITTTPYSQTVTASGGIGPYTFTVSVGALPAGLTLSAAGVVSGTPTTPGTANFTIQAKDSVNTTATQAFSNVLVYQKLVFTTSSIPTATFGVAYTATVSYTGGIAPFVCSLSTGTLPTGLTITTTGLACTIAGTPTQTGAFTFTLAVADNSQLTLLRINGIMYARLYPR